MIHVTILPYESNSTSLDKDSSWKSDSNASIVSDILIQKNLLFQKANYYCDSFAMLVEFWILHQGVLFKITQSVSTSSITGNGAILKIISVRGAKSVRFLGNLFLEFILMGGECQLYLLLVVICFLHVKTYQYQYSFLSGSILQFINFLK